MLMSLGLKGLGVAVAASGLVAFAADAGAPPPAGGQPEAGGANPWVESSRDPTAPLNGGAEMALQDGPDARYIGIDNLSRAGSTSGGVPEPAAWALMIVGFGGVGGLLRRRRAQRAPTGA